MYSIFEQLLKQSGERIKDISEATGIRAGVFSDWKNGRYTPKIDKLMLIAQHFGVSLEFISEHALEVYLWDNLRPLVQDLKLKYNVQQGSAPDVQKQLSAVRKKIDRLKELFINELISLDEYKTDKERYEKELADISALNAPVRPDFDALDKILAEGIEKLYQDFTEAEKRYFWRSIIRDITMGIDRVYHVSFLSCTN